MVNHCLVLFQRFTIVFAAVLVCLGYVHGCPISCSCIADEIACSYRRLTSLPSFSSSDFINVRVLDLSHNNFTSLPSNAFQNAKIETLRLNNNHIRSISNGSFNGLESTLQNLDLSNNELIKLPSALSDLNVLRSLNVSNNYRGSTNLELTASVMRALGDTVTEFTFGSVEQLEWPFELGAHLQTLHRLEVTSLHPDLIVIPPTGFHSFESTLTDLSIHDTNLLAVPLGISNLWNLKTLNYDYNLNTGDRGILLQSFPTSNKSKLETLTLKGDRLTVFPLVLKYLRHLKSFSIDDNALKLVSEETVEGLNTLQTLTIRNCSLERIPAALGNINLLRDIDFSFNSIETVEQRDLVGFGHIQKLTLANTPLKYISRDSLQPLLTLRDLNLNNTELTQVPMAINATTTLLKISMGGNQLDCMCENLGWLLYKEVGCNKTAHHQFRVIGECDTIHATLDHYLKTYVPDCPGYKEKCQIPPYNTGTAAPFK